MRGSSIGAPRFELGTSRQFRAMAGDGATWLELPRTQAFRGAGRREGASLRPPLPARLWTECGLALAAQQRAERIRAADRPSHAATDGWIEPGWIAGLLGFRLSSRRDVWHA